MGVGVLRMLLMVLRRVEVLGERRVRCVVFVACREERVRGRCIDGSLEKQVPEIKRMGYMMAIRRLGWALSSLTLAEGGGDRSERTEMTWRVRGSEALGESR